MKCFRRVLAFALTFVLCFSIAGCGKKPASSTSSNLADVTELEKVPDQTTEATEEITEATTEIAAPISVQVEKHYYTTWDDAYAKCYLESELQYPYIKEDVCPELKEAVNAEHDKELANDQKTNEGLIKSSKEENSDTPYANSNTISVKRADSNVFSYVSSFYSNMGGVHGMNGQTCFNYDARTGERIVLSDICKDEAKFEEAVYDALVKTYDADEVSGWDSYKENINFNAKVDEAGYIFCIEQTGISVYFNPYDIAAYASGSFQVFIPYSEDLFYEQYFNAPDYYISTITPEIANYIDLNDDGEVDSLTTNITSDENYGYTKAVITINGIEKSFDLYSFDADWYYVHSANGNYIYMSASIENDYKYLYVFKVNSKNKVRKIEDDNDLYGFPSENLKEGEDYYGRVTIPTDCDHLFIEKRSSLLSTYFATKECKVGDDGYPAEYDGLAVVTSDLKLKLKKDLELYVVNDQTGEETKEAYTLKAKDKIIIYKTDFTSIVDVKTKEGKVLRIHVKDKVYSDDNIYGQSVNGIPIEDLFKNLIFAG
ncbi:MAG: DUF3298 and DUF4163 domain-containing protein [Lachnospiraceae bacterium]|nr:DUF3298 and DUF4163 domain-containing protein [Lachnospiraceae bacterium]